MTSRITRRPTRGAGLTDEFDLATARATSCAGKDAFASKGAALMVVEHRLKRAKRRHNAHKGKRAIIAKIEAYRCEHCGQWRHGVGNRR